ncbi:hypothetical protein E3V90_04000 [Streptococcus pseudopneumoniae]|uniref:Uncharacterized protein n=1 Tax=Streptococcus pseudopneumoniae TaxID=257758 RepID=A0A3A4MWJ5_9STRE|nr:hypothetical protein C5O69_08170 [Streptococcus pseudopneumoniae]TMR50158.1 hypothetical protein E3V31_09015 [Streptococcus pseudopneumoniae]TMR58850.1 hypothetical protein E3V90_04000 [Streptococcus pseudopneumoniae]
MQIELTKSAQNTVLRLQIELTKSAQNTVLRLQIELTKSVTYTYGTTRLTWFEEYGTIITYLKILKDCKLLYLDK